MNTVKVFVDHQGQAWEVLDRHTRWLHAHLHSEARNAAARARRLAQTGDCPSEYPDNCPDLSTCPVHDDGTLFPDSVEETSKSTLADDLAALNIAIAARAAATPGPWWQDYGVVGSRDRTIVTYDGRDHQGYEDARFIALAANVIEAHGAELAALVAEGTTAKWLIAERGLAGALDRAIEHWSTHDDEIGRTVLSELRALRGPS